MKFPLTLILSMVRLPRPAPEIEGDCLAIGADGKGVRLIKSERPKQKVTREPKARLSRGRKARYEKRSRCYCGLFFQPAIKKA